MRRTLGGWLCYGRQRSLVGQRAAQAFALGNYHHSPGEPEGARSKMLQLQPSHHTDTINADVHTADVEWRRIDCWTLTQSGLVAGPVGPSLLIMTLITKVTTNYKVNSVISLPNPCASIDP